MAADTYSQFPQPGTLRNDGFPDIHRLDISARGLPHKFRLPHGYEYTDEASITELAYLQHDNFVDSGRDPQASPIGDWISEITDLKLYGVDYADVGVRAAGELVAFQRLAFRAGKGVLSSLVVDEWHRRRGIARTLVAECAYLADELGVVTLRTEKHKDGYLNGSYTDQGFRQFRKPHPKTGMVSFARTSSRNYPGGRVVPTVSS